MEDCFIVMDLPANSKKDIYEVGMERMKANEMFEHGGEVSFPNGTLENYFITRKKGGLITANRKEIGRLAKGKTLQEIADMHKVSLNHIEKQMDLGAVHEMEHTTDANIARAIAKDHIFEDKNYYSENKKPKQQPKPSAKKSRAGSPIFSLAKKLRTPGMSWEDAKTSAKEQINKNK